LNFGDNLTASQRTISAFCIPWEPMAVALAAHFRISGFPSGEIPDKMIPEMNILAKNLLILASAGSGKTFQLGNRIIGLVAGGAEPERIVALTFTRKAAGEFSDSMLTKLAEAAASEAIAADLRQAISQPHADFKEALERVIRALPGLTLSTMDGFFAKIVRGFQYELGLTGGKFDLLEGPRAAALTDEMLTHILNDALAHEAGDEFFHAFRRATIGKEDQGVLNALRAFVNQWQSRYQESADLEWGPPSLVNVLPEEWAKQKSGLAAAVLRGLDDIVYTRNGQREALEKEIANLENHVIGGGSLGSRVSSLMASILEAVASQTGDLTVKSYKEFTIGGHTADALRAMVELAARCEFAAALLRTRAVRQVVSAFDALCARRLRRKGMLGFNDVKLLMGDWARSENARLRREAVDFRLDSRIDHWLLDEFQDTSRADWSGLQPLIDEAATGEDGSLFIVGDRKQAIYAWRGGDVGLFDEVIARYQGGLEIESMAESWRSCPEVLALVNEVCGDLNSMHEIFGDAADKWDWQTHFPAEPLQRPAKRGQAVVEVVGDWDERLERLIRILHELGVGRRAMSCGILLRGNKQAREVTDHLRAHGFDVIEEGRREPAKDNPVGIAIAHLLKWLANPADAMAREIVEMSPLAATLRKNHGDPWWKIWEQLTHCISRHGFAATIGGIVADTSADWSEFGRRRSGDLIAALAALDAQGGVSIKEAADWLDRLEVSQSPGVAAVQVMTIHKAKGLGFDVVILPEIPDETFPQSQYFDVAEGDGWLTQTPPKWARAIIPELREAENRWAASQRYEAFCMLYVALTRAKRGLYVLLEPPSKTSDPDKPSLANWLGRSAGADGKSGVVYQNGGSSWPENIQTLNRDPSPDQAPPPGTAVPRRRQFTPSGSKSKTQAPKHSTAGMRFGTEVHAILENVTWLDDFHPDLPPTDAGKAVARLLQNPDLDAVFFKRDRNIDLFLEQSADAIVDGQLLSGIIDRLHLHRSPNGEVIKIEIIDFKTDAVKTPDELIERYAGQMTAYQEALHRIHPRVEIASALLSVRLCQLVSVPRPV
jgi:ATP-dependent exoDNAse (exonuclease V) beta subunit